MKKSVFFVLSAFLFLSSCATIEFENPMPHAGKIVEKCPTELLGKYHDVADSASIGLLKSTLSFASLDASQLKIYEYSTFTESDLTKHPTFTVRNDTLFERITWTEKETGEMRDSMNTQRVSQTKEGFETGKKLIFSFDFDTRKMEDYDSGSAATPKSTVFEMRKRGDVFYLNIQNQESQTGSWFVVALKPSDTGLTINMLSSFERVVSNKKEEDIHKIMPIKKIGDDNYIAKPTDAQFDIFMKQPFVGEIMVFKRIQN